MKGTSFKSKLEESVEDNIKDVSKYVDEAGFNVKIYSDNNIIFYEKKKESYFKIMRLIHQNPTPVIGNYIKHLSSKHHVDLQYHNKYKKNIINLDITSLTPELQYDLNYFMFVKDGTFDSTKEVVVDGRKQYITEQVKGVYFCSITNTIYFLLPISSAIPNFNPTFVNIAMEHKNIISEVNGSYETVLFQAGTYGNTHTIIRFNNSYYIPLFQYENQPSNKLYLEFDNIGELLFQVISESKNLMEFSSDLREIASSEIEIPNLTDDIK